MKDEPTQGELDEFMDELKSGQIKNGGQECDVLSGPCACGAWHTFDEMKYRRMRSGMIPTPGKDPREVLRLVKD